MNKYMQLPGSPMEKAIKTIFPDPDFIGTALGGLAHYAQNKWHSLPGSGGNVDRETIHKLIDAGLVCYYKEPIYNSKRGFVGLSEQWFWRSDLEYLPLGPMLIDNLVKEFEKFFAPQSILRKSTEGFNNGQKQLWDKAKDRLRIMEQIIGLKPITVPIKEHQKNPLS
jgi:hypothetical protein